VPPPGWNAQQRRAFSVLEHDEIARAIPVSNQQELSAAYCGSRARNLMPLPVRVSNLQSIEHQRRALTCAAGDCSQTDDGENDEPENKEEPYNGSDPQRWIPHGHGDHRKQHHQLQSSRRAEQRANRRSVAVGSDFRHRTGQGAGKAFMRIHRLVAVYSCTASRPVASLPRYVPVSHANRVHWCQWRGDAVGLASRGVTDGSQRSPRPPARGNTEV
jgi:hypothetical protein